jgi:diguanylate cyclase (GGDEF)-like protein
MNFDDAIEGLQKLATEVSNASLTDDRTPLGSARALRQEERLINEGASQFDVIVFGDLDDFKHLNDLHGHDAGNVAISEVGAVIQRFVIEDLQGKAFRQSGDEFVILLKLNLMDKFLERAPSFSHIPFSHNERSLSTAMSFGYTVSDGKTSFADLLQRAEVACQMAKASDLETAMQWTETLKLNPLVRITGSCHKCSARISCNVPKQSAPAALKVCPCCSEPLRDSESYNSNES